MKLAWTTEKRKLSEITEYKGNPRILTKKQYADLKKSLKKFDLAEIPAINKDNTLLAGHQRLRILSELKGDIEIDVRVPNRQLTDKEAEEYLIRSNKNTGEWDFDILANEFDMEGLLDWGFNEKELTVFDGFDFENITDELMDNNATDREHGKLLNLKKCPECGAEFEG